MMLFLSLPYQLQEKKRAILVALSNSQNCSKSPIDFAQLFNLHCSTSSFTLYCIFYSAEPIIECIEVT